MSASQSAPSEFSVTCSPRKRIAHLCKCLSNEHAPEPIDRTDGWLGQALDFTGHSRVMMYEAADADGRGGDCDGVLATHADPVPTLLYIQPFGELFSNGP